ncbi:MAG: M28 family metallopeptidase [Cyanobacteriota bacterium]
MTRKQDIAVAILVIDQALGTVRLSKRQVVLGLDLAAGVARALETLRTAGVRIALAHPNEGANPSCDRVDSPAIDAPLLDVRGAPSAWIARCVAELGAPAEATLFVSADSTLRAAAQTLGLPTAPHAAIAAWLATGRVPLFVRIQAPRNLLAEAEDLVVFHGRNAASESIVWGCIPADTRSDFVQPGTSLQVLRMDPAVADPYLYHFDQRRGMAARGDLAPLDLVWSDGHVALISVPPAKMACVEDIASRHQCAILAPNPSMAVLQPRQSSWAAACIAPTKREPAQRSANSAASGSSGFAGPTAMAVQFDVSRYSGATPIDASGKILSRHVHHPHAQRAVQAIIADLQAVGYTPYTHTFSYQGKVLTNVIADLPGKGSSPLPAQSLCGLRETIRTHASSPDLLGFLAQELGDNWVRGEALETIPSTRLVAEVERKFGLGGWIPWWRDADSVSGFGAEIVIVGCHLDSTAQGSPGFNPTTSPAPGADDDASGIACTLAAARYLAGFRGMLTHTVRFCFLNAEEQGLVGSAAYANHLKSTGAPVKAVICVDMIGYDVEAEHSFEIHAGATDVSVRNASVVVAKSIAKWASDVTMLGPAQIYSGTSSLEKPNRDLYDPAIGRADHASFQNQGYPAVVISEDYFINQAGEGAPEPNPNYHRFSDVSVNATYAADIARAISYAVEELAR